MLAFILYFKGPMVFQDYVEKYLTIYSGMLRILFLKMLIRLEYHGVRFGSNFNTPHYGPSFSTDKRCHFISY